MKKEARVHRLSTEDKSAIIHIAKDTGSLLCGEKYLNEPYPNLNSFHLYITTDEKIKEGDWYLWGGAEQKNIYQCKVSEAGDLDKLNTECKSLAKKIIATTDPKLHTNEIVEEDMHMYKKSLPQIPQSFIKEYCKAGGIDEVLVEYHPKGCSYGNIILDDLNGDGSYYGDNNKYEVEISRSRKEVESYGAKFHDSLLKLDNNCIIIHPVKEKMYSREEFETKLKEAFHIGYENCQYNHSLTVTARKVDLDKWIEENL